MNTRRVPCGVGIVLIKDGRLLLMERQGSHGAGHWAVPGGWIDWGETPLQTAVREAEEELGVYVDPSSIKKIGFTYGEHPEKDLCSVSLTLAIEAWEGEPTICEPHKCSDMQWVLPWDLHKYTLFNHLEEALDDHIMDYWMHKNLQDFLAATVGGMGR